MILAEKEGFFRKGFAYIKNLSLIISGLSVLIIMGIIVVDVILRNIFNDSISGNYEIIQKYFMPLAVFPALALTYGSGLMPRLEMFVVKMPAKIQKYIAVALAVIDLIIMLLITVYTLNYAVQALGEKITFPAGGSMYPLYPVLFIVPIGFFMLAIEVLFKVIDSFRTGDQHL